MRLFDMTKVTGYIYPQKLVFSADLNKNMMNIFYIDHFLYICSHLLHNFKLSIICKLKQLI